MRILSIDFGEKRIGLAISDPLGITAQGLESYSREGGDRDFAYFRNLCEKEQIVKCVVGLPLCMNGQIGYKAREVLEWVSQLQTKLSCPVQTWDERLTTREATRLMIQQGLSRKKQKAKNDQLAAILILQNYLDAHRTS